VIRNYAELEKIGEGGFGIVDKVVDDEGRFWARKTFKDPRIPDVDVVSLRKRFVREVNYQSQFNHPNIVKVTGSELECDPPYFVMELAEGTLHEELRADHTLGGDPGPALFDVLAALEEVHALGISHRDLKPANILRLANEDASFRYAISDFGLMSAAESQSSTLTQSNMGGGTPLYAAPECAINFKKATPLSDIYSLGAILHDIFVGGSRVPYTPLNGPGAVGAIIEKATQKLPMRRYKGVAELRLDLFEALNQEQLVFASNEEESVVACLQSDQVLSDDEWDRLFILIEDYEDNDRSLTNLFRYISISHIDQLHENAPELLSGLGKSYCRHVQTGTFNFDYCDVLASKIQHFFLRGDVELKAFALLALLCMGTSHNRWYVEGIFASLAGTDLPDDVAKRMMIEVKVQGLEYQRLISHVERSISFARTSLHSVLFIAP